jgi:hypothetical protein
VSDEAEWDVTGLGLEHVEPAPELDDLLDGELLVGLRVLAHLLLPGEEPLGKERQDTVLRERERVRKELGAIGVGLLPVPVRPQDGRLRLPCRTNEEC